MIRTFIFVITLLLLYIICLGQIKENKQTTVKTYFKNGKLASETQMQNGKKNGEEKLYFDNGNLMIKQYFKNDLFIDSFYQYDKYHPGVLNIKGYVTQISRVVSIDQPSNRIIGTADYKEKAIGEGIVKIYYPDGNVMSISEYKNDKRNGIEVLYFDNGNIRKIVHYKQGKQTYPIIAFDSTGKMTEYVPLNDSVQKN